jgi:Mg-chelatase subunit ChlD
MLKAWEVLKEAKRRDPSTIPVMAIITDGNANVPLRRSLETGEIRRIEEAEIIVRKYEDVAVHDVFSVAKMISREGINTIVINTNPHMLGKETYGKLVTEALAKMTGGSHHFVGRAFTPEELIENVTERIAEDQRRIAYESSRIPASKHWIQPD